MRYFFFFLTLAAIFIVGFGIFYIAVEWYIRKNYKKNIDKKIKDILFREMGFTYRETAKGRRFLIIDEYKNSRAIQL